MDRFSKGIFTGISSLNFENGRHYKPPSPPAMLLRRFGEWPFGYLPISSASLGACPGLPRLTLGLAVDPRLTDLPLFISDIIVIKC